jgi:phosphatidylglycerol:prolipoprotein diacylglycerol transferase
LSNRCKIPVLKLSDCFLCGTALAQSIGRWGNFFNSEAFGLPTDLPWKLFIPLSKRPAPFASNEYFHPAFLYEGILDLLIFFVLLALFRRFSKKPGIITCLYLILYSCARIFVESLRIDSVLDIQGFPVAQVISAALILIALAFLPVFYFRNINNP